MNDWKEESEVKGRKKTRWGLSLSSCPLLVFVFRLSEGNGGRGQRKDEATLVSPSVLLSFLQLLLLSAVSFSAGFISFICCSSLS